jgi:hypothetical protein
MSEHIEGFAIVDRRRSADLDDMGGRGLTVVVAIDTDGSELLGVVERSAVGDRTQGFGMGSTPPHEETGPLGLGTKRRIALGQNITTPTGQETLE